MATSGKPAATTRSRKPKQNLDQMDLWGQVRPMEDASLVDRSPEVPLSEIPASDGAENEWVPVASDAPAPAVPATIAVGPENAANDAPAAPAAEPVTEALARRAPRENGAATSVSRLFGAVGGARPSPALTRRQIDLLAYLKQRQQRGANPPSLPEICRDLGLSSRGSLHKQVVALVEAGLVEPMAGKQRGVRLISAANDDERMVPMLGAIAAGRPIEAMFHGESLALPGWLKTAPNCFALRVRGDSMRDAGILDGDVVVVEARTAARDGETVVALIDGEEATLKRIEQRPDAVILHSANPAFEPMRFGHGQVQVQGIVVAQIRKY